MVNYSRATLDATFGALADATRRAILARLARGDSSVSDLAAPFHMSLPAVSKHLRVLQRARLLKRSKNGRVHHCRLSPGPLKDAAEWIRFYQQFWQNQFDALAEFLEDTNDEEASWGHPQRDSKPLSKSGGHLRPRRKKSSMRGRSPK